MSSNKPFDTCGLIVVLLAWSAMITALVIFLAEDGSLVIWVNPSKSQPPLSSLSGDGNLSEDVGLASTSPDISLSIASGDDSLENTSGDALRSQLPPSSIRQSSSSGDIRLFLPGSSGESPSLFMFLRGSGGPRIVSLTADGLTVTNPGHPVRVRFGGSSNTRRNWSFTESLYGDSTDSPFVRPHEINFTKHGYCRGLVPPSSPPISSFLALGSDVDGSEQLLEEQKSQPLFIWAPRFGLGNSMRSFSSSLLYAMLSGRRFLVWQGGSHGKVSQALCSAFHCSLDSLLNVSDIRGLARSFSIRQKEGQILASMKRKGPGALVVHHGSYWDHFWAKRYRSRRCILLAFGCSDEWCVRSHEMRLLFRKGPRKELGEVVEEVVEGVEGGTKVAGEELERLAEQGAQAAAVGDGDDDTAGQGQEGTTEDRVSASPSLHDLPSDRFRVEKGKGLLLQFDVALHIRTQIMSTERMFGNCSHNDTRCMSSALTKDVHKKTHAYTRPSKWACILSSLHLLKSQKQAQGLADKQRFTIFLATDSIEMRPLFIRLLRTVGDVYFSSGLVGHLSKTNNGMSRLSTLGELYLMSRSTFIMSFVNQVSSFAIVAALMGNTTLVTNTVAYPTCNFSFHHVAVAFS